MKLGTSETPKDTEGCWILESRSILLCSVLQYVNFILLRSKIQRKGRRRPLADEVAGLDPLVRAVVVDDAEVVLRVGVLEAEAPGGREALVLYPGLGVRG